MIGDDRTVVTRTCVIDIQSEVACCRMNLVLLVIMKSLLNIKYNYYEVKILNPRHVFDFDYTQIFGFMVTLSLYMSLAFP